jgi:hypothetical protein
MSKPWKLVAHAAASLLVAGTAAASLAQDAQPSESPGAPQVVECDRFGHLVSQPCPPSAEQGAQAQGAGAVNLDGEQVSQQAESTEQKTQ